VLVLDEATSELDALMVQKIFALCERLNRELGTTIVLVSHELELLARHAQRLVVLHDPAGQPTWEGTTRVIAYIDADVDLEVAADPVLPEVGWAWLNEALTESNADAQALGGTVTQVFSRSFGVMESREPEGRLQVRASWTPTDPSQLIPHARAWALLTASACGLTPNSEGVTNLIRHR